MRSTMATAAAAIVLAVSASAAMAANRPDRIGLHPVEGAHWQARTGLPDARGRADQALVRGVDGTDAHPDAAVVTGLEGADTGDVRHLGFTVAGDDAEIIPCIRIAYTDALGEHRELMITRAMRTAPAPRAGWTIHSIDPALPPGGRVEALVIGLHVATESLEPTRVLFDDIAVNDRVFTHPGDGGP